jgi:hypothetical protein
LYSGIQIITKTLRQIVAGTKQRRKEKKKMRNKQQAPRLKHQATSDPRLSKTAIKIHEAWAFQNGYRAQASSNKLPGSRYKSSDFSKRAT